MQLRVLKKLKISNRKLLLFSFQLIKECLENEKKYFSEINFYPMVLVVAP